jgi:hypothetical protein
VEVAHDAAVAAILREALASEAPEERRMFGALCFMLRGNILCGALPDGGFFRVGPERMPDALAETAARPMAMRGRPMSGFVRVPAASVADPASRGRLLGLAKTFVRGLPAK